MDMDGQFSEMRIKGGEAKIDPVLLVKDL